MKPVVHVTRDTEYGYRLTCKELGFHNHRLSPAGMAGALCEEILDLNAQLQFRDEQLQKLRDEVEKLHQEKNTARIPRASLMSNDDAPDQIKYATRLLRKYKRRIRLVTKSPDNSAKEFGYLHKNVDALEFHERTGGWQQLANACELDLVMYVEPQWYSFYGVPRREQH